MSLGNINKQKFSEMWNGERALTLRRAVRTRNARPGFCRQCPYQERIQDTCVISHTELKPA
jgi:radical SAM protein with 4Fe4S-binding SPASM domain